MRFLAYLAMRIGWLIAVMLGVVTLTFLITNVVPADPARLAAGLEAQQAQVDTMRHLMGLDQPLPVQYWNYLVRLLHGDLGLDARSQRPVVTQLAEYFPATFELVIVTMTLYILLGVIGGVAAAVERGSWVDKGAQLLSLGGLAMPPFWVAIVFQVVFFAQLHWLPATGRLSAVLAPPPHITGLYLVDSLVAGQWGTWCDAAVHIMLPAVTLLVGSVANVLRITRRAMLQVFAQPYVATARAKGLSERIVIWRHCLRNSAIPILTMIGLQAGYLFSGAIIIEIVFSWPGLGKYAVDSIANLDFPPIMGVTLIVAAAFVLINLLIDLAYPLVDPRIVY